MAKKQNKQSKSFILDLFGIAGTEKHIILITGTIDTPLLDDVYKQLHTVEKSVASARTKQELQTDEQGNIPLHIIINSGGGDVSVGVGLYELFATILPARGYKVITHALSQVTSAASIIFLSGVRRVVYSNSYGLIHGVSQPPDHRTTNASVIADRDATFQMSKKLIQTIYRTRTSLSLARINQLSLIGECFDAEGLLRLGFATEGVF